MTCQPSHSDGVFRGVWRPAIRRHVSAISSSRQISISSAGHIGGGISDQASDQPRQQQRVRLLNASFDQGADGPRSSRKISHAGRPPVIQRHGNLEYPRQFFGDHRGERLDRQGPQPPRSPLVLAVPSFRPAGGPKGAPMPKHAKHRRFDMLSKVHKRRRRFGAEPCRLKVFPWRRCRVAVSARYGLG